MALLLYLFLEVIPVFFKKYEANKVQTLILLAREWLMVHGGKWTLICDAVPGMKHRMTTHDRPAVCLKGCT